MSFMGSIGQIMSGSGLEDVLKLIYAENTVKHILSGHAYGRAMRAHSLIQLSIAKIIFELADVDETLKVRSDLDNFFTSNDEETKRQFFSPFENSTYQRQLSDLFGKQLEQIAQMGPTAKLWLQYFKMVTLLKRLVEAERSGNWNLHLATVKQMLPYFHAAGHVNYAKSAHLYLQDMATLEEKMPREEFKAFTEDGYFTIRRTNKFWSGIPSDQTIEQTLMRSSKVQGGIFQHGRGSTDSIRTKWTLGRLSLTDVCEQVERFCKIRFQTSDQHVDFRPSRVDRDNSDTEKIDFWFAAHPPFSQGTSIKSISTGIIGDVLINCYLAEEIGTELMTSMSSGLKTFGSLTCKRIDKVVPLSRMTETMTSRETKDTINPLLLFQRMCFSNPKESDLKTYLSYELSPFPTSLFSGEEMRKNVKSNLYKAFSPLSSTNINFGLRYSYVVDGGFLLHKVVWDNNANFSEICTKYTRYVNDHFRGSETIVVFDGYEVNCRYAGTKAAERLRRSNKQSSPDVQFEGNTVPVISKEQFLANESNKARLIPLLRKHLEACGVIVEQAFEDADFLIIETAIQKSTNFDSVIVVGEDIDLLVILTGRAPLESNIYFQKPSRQATPEKIFSPRSFQHDIGAKENILFLHAMSGCDTTSALFNQGKMKFLSTLSKYETLQKSVSVFLEKKINSDVIVSVGTNFLIKLYSGNNFKENSLDTLRFKMFARSLKYKKIELSSLPPTAAAAKQHCLRVYYQVQQWMGNIIEPTDWGWKRSSKGLEPVKTDKEHAPPALLNLVSCGCTKNCGRACGCRKAGLNCSVICKNCCGKTCDNASNLESESEEENYDSDEVPSQVLGSFFNKNLSNSPTKFEDVSEAQNEGDETSSKRRKRD